MKRRVLLASAAALVIVLGIVLVKGLSSSSRQVRPPAIEEAPVDEAAVAAHLAGSIRFATVSHEKREDDEVEPWEGLHAFLAETYPKTFAALQIERIGDFGLMMSWPGEDPSLAPVVLCAHLDVVPADPTRWTHPPFAGVVEGGWVWGRGALDDKGVAITMLEAAEGLVGAGWSPKRSLVFAFGQDEEVGGQRGAVKMAARLEERLAGKKAHFVVDEGMAITYGLVPGVEPPVGFIGVAEKGYVTLELTVESQGGHSSMPPKETAVGILANAVARVEANPMPASMAGLPTRTFETLGPELPLAQKIIMANLWLFGPVVKQLLDGGNSTRALIRTTTAPTMLSGSPKDNVLAQEAHAAVNFRIKPGDTIEGVRRHVVEAIGDGRVKVEPRLGGLGNEPSPLSPDSGPGYDEIERAAREVFPEVIMAPNLVLGATDGRHYQRVSERVYRFTPMQVDSEALDGIHGVNERIKTSNLVGMVRFYRRLLELSAG